MCRIRPLRALVPVLAVLALAAVGVDAKAQSMPTSGVEPVRDVQATASATSTRVTVTWQPASGGAEPAAYAVAATTDAGAPIGRPATCDHPCTSRTVDGLEPGAYRFQVAAVSATGQLSAWAGTTRTTTVADRCPDGGACVVVDTATTDGAARLRAQGINANLGGADLDRLRELRVQDVRASDGTTYDAARAIGAEVTWLLSNSWYGDTGGYRTGRAAFPWADWSAYESWAGFYAQFLRAVAPVDFWDVQNEPYVGYFGGTESRYAYSHDLLGEHLARAEDALHGGDSSARVVGPSFDTWNESAMRAFLDEAVERGIDLAAVSWHELEPRGGSVNGSPRDVVEHVQRARQLLAERPSLGSPEIHVNEYGGPSTLHVPGWGAGFIAALEDADVDLAMRACWSDAECAWNGSAGGLFEPGTGRTTAAYWVHRFYADQTGHRVETSSSNGNVSAFATRDGGTVRVLVGRHQGGVGAGAGSSFDVPVRIDGLADGATLPVLVQRVPSYGGPLDAPIEVRRTTATVTNGSVTVVLPAVADGEAWFVTVG